MKKINSKKFWNKYEKKDKKSLHNNQKKYDFSKIINKLFVISKLDWDFIKISFRNISATLILSISLIYLEKLLFSNFIELENNFGHLLQIHKLKSYYNDFLLALLSVSGIFLGLVYSNFSNVYSAKYADVPKEISDLFLKEIITSNYIQDVIKFNIFILTLIVFNLFSYSINYIIFFLVIILTIYIIVIFQEVGKIILSFSDFNTVTYQAYDDITKFYLNATVNNNFWNDKILQTNFREQSSQKINILLTLLEINTKNTNRSVSELLITNINILAKYSEQKHLIPYNSNWFEEEYIYNDVFLNDYFQKKFMIKTSYLGVPKKTENYYWFEDKFHKINISGLSLLIKEKDFYNISIILNKILSFDKKEKKHNFIASFLSNFSIEYFYKILSEISNLIIMGIEDEKDIIDKKVTIESLCLIYINTIIEVNNLFNKYFYNNYQIINNYIDEQEYSLEKSLKYNIPFINNSEISEKLYKIENEIKLEKEKITPNWLIFQFILNHFNNHLVKSNNLINFQLENFFYKNGNYFKEKKYFELATIFYVKGVEYFHRLNEINRNLLSISDNNNNYYIEKGYKWVNNKFDKKDNTEHLQNILLVLADTVIENRINDFANDDNNPDFVGFTYYQLFDSIIKSIINKDYNSFKKLFDKFYRLLLLSEQILNQRYNEHFEKNPPLFARSIQLWIDFHFIIGYATLISELYEIDNFDNFNEFINYFNENEEQKIQFYKRQASIAKYKKINNIYFGDADMFYSEYQDSLMNLIRYDKLLEWEYDEKSSSNKIKTNNSFLKAFFNSFDLNSNFFMEDIYEISIIKYINPHLPEDLRYKSSSGWEDLL